MTLTLQRAVGFLLVVLGAGIVGLAGYGFLGAEHMAVAVSLAQSSDASFDPADWLLHWRVASALLVAMGFAVGLCGVLFVRQKAMAYFVAALIAVFSALLPWLVPQHTAYSFERASLWGSFLLIAVAVAAIRIFSIRRRSH